MSIQGSKPKQIHYSTHLNNPSFISLGVTPLINPNLQRSLPDVTELIYNPRNEQKPALKDRKNHAIISDSNPQINCIQINKDFNYNSTHAIKQKQSSGFNIINLK